MCSKPRPSFVMPLIVALGIALAAVTALRSQPLAGVAAARAVFDNPPDDARPMMRWWWYGVAASPAQIRHDLEAMKAAGIGGAEIQPVYPLTLDSPSSGVVNHPFLSDAFLELVREAHVRGRDLGLRIDLTLGSGWPYGGPSVSIDDAAGQLRVERMTIAGGSGQVARPAMAAGESWIGAFIGPEGVAEAEPSVLQPLDWPPTTAMLDVGSTEGPRQVWAFIASRTGMMVKRPAIGSEGYVVSHYDRGALDRYLGGVGARLLQPLAGTMPFAIFCDSLEVFGSDWTPDLPAEFQRRRGYDIRPLLPWLVADRGEAGAMLREDWGRTLSELLDERFIRPLGAWARARGTKLRMQGYGVPPATISSNAAVDLPEGEGHHWRQLTASRWASSASHLFERPVASSETWTWLHSPSFRATPLELKAEADRHFLQGITQLIGHGWPSTPAGEDYPGWRFYAAAALNEKNPWWIVMPDVSRYLQRVSALLRLGRPGNDVALYLPITDAYGHSSPGRMHLLDLVKERLGEEIVGSVLDAGYGFDAVDDEALATHARLEGDRVAIGAGRYRAIVVPPMDAMPVATLAALDRFAAAGVVVISAGRAPVRPAGRRPEAERAAFAERARRFFDGGRTVPDTGASLRAALNARVEPPLRVVMAGRAADGSRMVPSEVGVIERRLHGGSLFFIANTSNAPVSLQVIPAPGVRALAVSNPVTGSHDLVSAEGGAVAMTLAPYESRIVWTSLGAPSRGLRIARAASARAETSVIGPWQVTAGRDVWSLDGNAMRGWDTRAATKYLSGTVSYTASFDAKRGPSARRVWLDFGEGTPLAGLRPGERASNNGFRALLEPPIREAAVIEVNGTRVGSLWTPPYRIEITSAMREGSNTLRVLVGNTAMNHMAGRPLPDYRLLNLRYGERFVPQDMKDVQVLPSGLTAPVRLVIE
jgi:hypothetical protein